MARSVVLVPFGWCPNGFDREEVKPGDERDFGDVTDGLTAIKMIGPVSEPVVEPVIAEATVVVETPVPEPAVIEPEVESAVIVAEPEPVIDIPAPIRRKRK